MLAGGENGRKKLKTTSKEKKNTIKNSYINGIKKLASVNSSALDSLTKRGLKHIQKNPTENVSIRKLKNRESAKNSRMRRKMYIELLEKKIMDQQEEFSMASKMMERMNANSKGGYGDTSLTNYEKNRQNFLEKLKDALSKNNDQGMTNVLTEMKVTIFSHFIINIKIGLFWRKWQ